MAEIQVVDPEQKPTKVKLTKAQKAAIKEQNLILVKKQYIRDQLKRELEFTDKSLKRGYKDWENICKEIKLKEFHNEINDWKQGVVRIMDRKNHRISILLDNLSVVEEQHIRNFSKHCKIIDFLIEFCDHMVSSLRNVYESNANDEITDFCNEISNRDGYQKRVQEYYENALHANNALTEMDFSNDDKNQTIKKENVIDTNISTRYTLRDMTLIKMNKLRNQLENVFRALENDTLTARPKDEFENLMDRQIAHEDDFVKQSEIAENGIPKIWELQSRLTKLEIEMNFKIKDMQLERNYFIEFYWNLKTKVKRNLEVTHMELKELASESYNIIEIFKKLAKSGELLLSLSTCCRKYQTEKEKVVPWFLDEKVQESKRIDDEIKKDQNLNDALLTYIELLRKFNFRASKAQTHVLLLKKDKEQLQKENETYCDIIRKCYETSTLERLMRSIKESEYLLVMKNEGKFD